MEDLKTLARSLVLFLGPIGIGILVGMLASRLGMAQLNASLLGFTVYQFLALAISAVHELCSAIRSKNP